VSKLQKNPLRIFPCFLWLAILVSGCKEQQPEAKVAEDQPKPAPQTLYVHAATSMQDALNDALDLYKKTRSTNIAANYASSAALAQQISQGSPADLFLSASLEWVELLEKENRIARRKDLLGNQLVLIVPSDSKLALTKLEDLSSADIAHLALADPDSVPAGKYAKQALEKAGVWNAVEDRIVRGSDVRQALAYVEQGEAEAGIVYATDASASKAVQVVYEVPGSLSEPIVYPLALIKPDDSDIKPEGADHTAEAETLFDFLCSPKAAEVFAKHGFEILPQKP
jgi:molybdate transport system substrate-binding protein